MIWVSLAGIAFIVLLARLLGFADVPWLHRSDEAARLAAEALPGFEPVEAVLAEDGRGALVAADDGRVALLRPLGDRWVVRALDGARAEARDGRLRITLAEPMFAPVDLPLGRAAAAWAARL